MVSYCLFQLCFGFILDTLESSIPDSWIRVYDSGTGLSNVIVDQVMFDLPNLTRFASRSGLVICIHVW